MRYKAILILLSFCSGIMAQEVVSSSGSTLTSGSGSISFTIGEGVANTLSAGDKTVTQGFQQPSLTVSIVSEKIELDFSISVFPNPATDILTIKVSKDEITGLKYQLLDISGRLIMQKNMEAPETIIPFQQISKGVYILKILSGTGELKSFKVVKE